MAHWHKRRDNFVVNSLRTRRSSRCRQVRHQHSFRVIQQLLRYPTTPQQDSIHTCPLPAIHTACTTVYTTATGMPTASTHPCRLL